jgi:predicted nucleic-acid-binding protein
MVSIDTNVVVRVLVNDDPAQARRAVALIKDNDIFIAKTVILESEWVLRGAYKLDRGRVNTALRAFLSLDRLLIEDEEAVFSALDAHADGLDFADAMHVASSRRAESFATFDAGLRARGRALSLKPPVTAP